MCPDMNDRKLKFGKQTFLFSNFSLELVFSKLRLLVLCLRWYGLVRSRLILQACSHILFIETSSLPVKLENS